jgi:hypothetical protein
MAEIIGSLFAAIAPAAATGAAATTATAATAATTSFGSFLSSALTTSSTLLTGLQGVGALLAIGAKNRAGSEKKDAYFQQAGEAELDAQAEGVAGLQRQTQIRKQLLDTMAERDLQAAGGGLDLGFGTPALAREEAQGDAERALQLDKLETEGKQARIRDRSAALIRAGRYARRGAMIESLGTALDTGTDILQRGQTPRRQKAA